VYRGIEIEKIKENDNHICMYIDQNKNSITSSYPRGGWMVKVTIIIGLLFFNSLLWSQETWKIGDCIDYALEHNLDLNLKYNEVETGQVTLKESKTQLYPDLNMGSGLDYNFGRAITGDNTVTFDPTLSNNYYLISSFTLFQGMVKRNNIKYQDFLLKAKLEELEIEKNQLVTRILSSYYTVLYSKGLTEVAESQLSLSQQQFERMLKFVEVGKESPIAAQDLKSQMAADQLSLTKAENQLNKALLELKQLLRLNASQSFDIAEMPENDFTILSEYHIEEVYTMAAEVLPQLKKQEFLLGLSERDLKIAKGYIYPSVGMQIGVNSGFYSTSDINFMKQIENNQNQWIGASVRIPIFNQHQTTSRIKRKRIAVNSQKIQVEKHREALYIEVWNAIEDLGSAEKEYKSSEELYDFSNLNLKNVTKKLEKGLANTTEFETAKQRFISAKANLLKSKMIYIMRSDMLEFYQTGHWAHLY